MRIIYIWLLVLLFPLFLNAQRNYIVKLSSSDNLPSFEEVNGVSKYIGTNRQESNFFEKYDTFKMFRACPNSKRENVLKYAIVKAPNKDMIEALLKEFPSKYISYEDITELAKPELLYDTPHNNNKGYAAPNPLTYHKIKKPTKGSIENPAPFYPNDYWTQFPLNQQQASDYNIFDRYEFEYLEVPKAWGILNGGGNSDVKIGISDAKIEHIDPDFLYKTEFINYTYHDVEYNDSTVSTFHGTAVAAIAAAQGNNDFASAGVCYNCNIIATDYGANMAGYNRLLDLAIEGVKVINISWAHGSSLPPEEFILSEYGTYINNIIKEISEDYRTLIVAGAGNSQIYNTVTGTLQEKYYYPASFDNVISVSMVFFRNEYNPDNAYNTCVVGDEILYQVEGSAFYAINIGVNPAVPEFYGCSEDVYIAPDLFHDGSAAFNNRVDIVTAGNGVLSHPFAIHQRPGGKYGGGTSSSAPLVSGTLGLMLSRDSCLTPDEAEDILKLTSENVEYLPFNSMLFGLMGAGSLHTGDAIEFVDEMNKVNGNAEIRDQIFNRFDLSALRIKNNLSLGDVSFINESVAHFKARNEITIENNTLIEPNTEGSFLIEIEEYPISLTCELDYNHKKDNKSRKKIVSKEAIMIKLFPNPTSNILNIISDKKVTSYTLSNSIGVSFAHEKFKSQDKKEFSFKTDHLPVGIYFLNLTLNNGEQIQKTVIKN